MTDKKKSLFRFFKAAPVVGSSDSSDPIGGNTPVNEVIDWVVSGSVGAAVVGVLALGLLFL